MRYSRNDYRFVTRAGRQLQDLHPIQLRSAATAAIRSAVSATDGRYQFNLLPPGEYDVTAETAGFKKFVADAIQGDYEMRRSIAMPEAPTEARTRLRRIHLRLERGLASFDVRQRWVTSVGYELPFKARILGGWQFSSILSLQDGFPLTINLAGDTASTSRWFNPAAFVAPPAFQFGTLSTVTSTGRVSAAGETIPDATLQLTHQ